MKLSNKYSQFKDKNTMVIVSGTKTGFVYLIKHNEITIAGSCQVDKPTSEYTDNEGFFMRSGRGVNLGSGAPREPQKQLERQNFLNALTAEVEKNFDPDIEDVYVAAPEFIQPQLFSRLPRAVREKTAESVNGNYTKEHVTKVLERLHAQQKEKKDPATAEAKKLLKKN